MKKILLDELKDTCILHFTNNNNLAKIEEEGLIPLIGQNAQGIEKNPKIFFSKGKKGALELSEVWMRWLMNRIFGEKDRIGIYQNTSIKERRILLEKWFKEFLSGDYLKDTEKKQILFDYYFYYLEERIYLTLDIKDKEEYDSSAIDENKEAIIKENSNMKRLFAKIMYGNFSNIDSPLVEEWNMHTIPNISIKREKIKQVITKDGKEDMLSIIIEMYENYSEKIDGVPLLDEFIEYAKKRNELSKKKKKKERVETND